MSKPIKERISAVVGYATAELNGGKVSQDDKKFYKDFLDLSSKYDSLDKTQRGLLRDLLTFIESDKKAKNAKIKALDIQERKKRSEKEAQIRDRKHRSFILGGAVLGLDDIDRNKIILELSNFGKLHKRDREKFSIYFVENNEEYAKRQAKNNKYVVFPKRSSEILDKGITYLLVDGFICENYMLYSCKFYRVFAKDHSNRSGRNDKIYCQEVYDKKEIESTYQTPELLKVERNENE